MNQSQLENYLWGAAVILRGLVDAGDYKQFVFPLIFFKRLSDVWDEDHAAALAESKGDAAYASATANDRFVIPDGAHWKDVRAAAKDVGKKLQAALRTIESHRLAAHRQDAGRMPVPHAHQPYWHEPPSSQ